jgi:aspartate/methionine/tyrosine aminotransferase
VYYLVFVLYGVLHCLQLVNGDYVSSSYAMRKEERIMKGAVSLITHKIPVDITNASTYSAHSLQEQHTIVRQLRKELLLRLRSTLQHNVGPIRVMARMVVELEKQCRELAIAEEVMQSEIVNRTIGDINLRKITECEGEPGGPADYRLLADELGIALPNEQLHGYTASGETYLWLHDQMQQCERELLRQGIDLRNYDLHGVGNAMLRGWLAEEMQTLGLPVAVEQVYAAIGAMDGIDKVLRGLSQIHREQHNTTAAVLFPEPGFNVPEWQARSFGYRLHQFRTRAEDHFKLTAQQLDDILHQTSDIRVIYVTVTNNPTAFAYTAAELTRLFTVLQRYWQAGRVIHIIADLAYIGTAVPEEDQERIVTFADPDVLRHTIFVSTFSKSHTLTGERFGWVTIGDPKIATALMSSWSNTMASLPAEWQLRFMAYVRLIQSRPWIVEKLRAFYKLRRDRLITQLQKIDNEQHLFAQIHLGDDATVYNWSQLRSGEDAFSLFEKTGIAGVPGSGFGYTDDYIRLSIGVIPVPIPV